MFLFGGCAAEPPYAAVTNRPLTPEENVRKNILDDTEQARIKRALASVAGDHELADPPGPAEQGVRWADVPLAMHYATAEMEMAVVRTLEKVDRLVFELKTVDDRPGRIIVQRLGGDEVYDAEATIGRFDFPDDIALADRLLSAFDKQMRLFGQKRALRVRFDERR